MSSPLPSRGYIRVERVASGDIDDGDFVAGVDFVPYQVVGEVISEGRLVHWEAIDRERIEEILNELCRDWSHSFELGSGYDFGRAIDAIAEAIGGTDE